MEKDIPIIMSNALRITKKTFTWAVVLLTIAWSMGIAALMPQTAYAVDCPELEAFDLFQVDGSKAVYLLNADMERMYFPHQTVYETWYGTDFSQVVEIPKADSAGNACIDQYPSGKGVNYRPGSRLVKTIESPSVYAIGPDNAKHKLSSADVAKKLYGAKWEDKIVDLAPVFDANFSVGAAVAEATPHNGMLVKVSGEDTIYYVEDGEYLEVDGDLDSWVAASVQAVTQEVFDMGGEVGGTKTSASLTEDPTQMGSVPSEDEDEDEDEEETSGGDLSASLSANTAVAATLADGTQYNNLLTVNFKAGSKDVKIEGLTVTRTGLIANSNISGVSVWDGDGYRHGEIMTSFNTNNQVVIGFASDPIIVAAGTTEAVSVSFNLGTSAAGGTVGARIASASHVDTDGGEVSGSFPIDGNIMSIVDGSSSLADAKVEAQAVSAASASTASGNTEIGETKDIGKFKFSQSNGKGKITVEQVVFYLEGTIDDNDLKDFTLYSPTNDILGSAEWAVDRYVTLKLDKPYEIDTSKNRILTLKATAVDGSGKNFRVHVQNDYDLMVKDVALGYYILPYDVAAGTAWTDEVASDGWFILKSGTLNVVKTANSPSGNISAGTSDQLLAKFDVKGVGEDMEIRKIGVKIATTAGSTDLSGNVSLIVDGTTLLTFSGDYSAALYSTGSQRTLSQYLYVKSGETKVLEVYGNIDSNASADTYQVSVGNFYAKRISTKNFADNIPSAGYTDATGNVLTVETTSVTFVKDTSVPNKTVSKGATQLIGQFLVKAGSAEGVCLTGVSMSFGGTGNAPTDIQNLQLLFGDEEFGSLVSTVATSANSFTANKCLEPNESKTLKVKAFVVSTANSANLVASTTSYTYIGKVTQNSTSQTNSVVGQTTTLGSPNVILTAASDASTISAIRLPGESQQVGKWKVESQYETVIFKKMTFQVRDHTFANDTSAGNFGSFSLYDSADMSKSIGTASYIPGTGNGYVRFNGMTWSVPADSIKYLVLKANVNGSGGMDVASVNTFVIASDSSTDMDVAASNGSLTTSQIDATSGDNTTNTHFATTTYYLYHNAAPTVGKVSVGTALDTSSQSKLFSFKVENNGDRELRLATFTINVAATGMTATGATTGTVQSWELWEANATGGLGTQLATTSTCQLTGGALASGCYYNATSGSSVNVSFGEVNDVNSLLASLTVAAGGSRTFILVANASGAANGKTTGTINVTPKLDGSTGYSNGDSNFEANWNDGPSGVAPLQYFYTPVGGSENSTAYAASDSYDVVGDTLKLTL
ncbi:MAG: hypothetical protein A3G08_01500 [Candidatus Magasanikbacteria bacterium RIFCSPLOWO2_12_FULL_47_9b]|nr:MAG: hypothetical protein A3G08_01500 [Candidatus Magasanikbacteria bacterium RIFCSPLOWO2_12_FULL_47_9b]